MRALLFHALELVDSHLKVLDGGGVQRFALLDGYVQLLVLVDLKRFDLRAQRDVELGEVLVDGELSGEVVRRAARLPLDCLLGRFDLTNWVEKFH